MLHSGALALAAPALHTVSTAFSSAFAQVQAGEKAWLHGLSLFGDLKYPAGFKHFEYVNPSAPKAGGARLSPSAPTTISTWSSRA